jgi:glutamyl-tRNA synthetase
MPELESHGVKADIEKVTSVIGLVKERASFVRDLWDQSWFFFQPPETYDDKMVKKRWKEDSSRQMELLMNELASCKKFQADSIEETVKSFIATHDLGTGAVMSVWRLLLVGAPMGPGLFEIAEILGQEEVLLRMQNSIEKLNRSAYGLK